MNNYGIESIYMQLNPTHSPIIVRREDEEPGEERPNGLFVQKCQSIEQQREGNFLLASRYSILYSMDIIGGGTLSNKDHGVVKIEPTCT